MGKTTCAAATAVHAARNGLRVLVVSVDPASSLGDALGVPLTGTARNIPVRTGRLAAIEIDAARALRRWLRERRSLLESIAVQGTWLDREDVGRLLRLSLPGIDELAALIEIRRLASSRRFDLVVVDTAPTGHTLRMLSMPETLFALAGVFDRMREKQRVVQEALRGGWNETAEDRLITELADTARHLHATLRDTNATEFSWVTLLEPMAVAETLDAVKAVEDAGMAVRRVIANRVTPPPGRRCAHCEARQAFERQALESLQAPPVALFARDREPVGLKALEAMGRDLEGAAALPARKAMPSRKWIARAGGQHVEPASLLSPSHRMVLLGGKGGVGKTTCASALALSACARWPERRVLLISTDPAHSLADVFGEDVGDVPSALVNGPTNLHVRELDASVVLRRLQQRYTRAIDAVFDRMRGGSAFDAAHDRAVMRGLIELAPPGLDELAAILEITDAIGGDAPAWDLVVMDTAPTGHALRLLEMPALIHDWLKALMAILLKYQGVTPLGDLGALLVRLSKGVRALRSLLADERHAAFIPVTRPAALPRVETLRLLRRLARLGLACPAIIVNAVGRGTCDRCATGAREQNAELQALRRGVGARRGPVRLLTAPAMIPPPRGVEAVSDWSGRWTEPVSTGGTRGISSSR